MDRDTPWWHPQRWLREENMGLVLDATVFVSNMLFLDLLARGFVALVQRADGGDRDAMGWLAAFCVALFVLMPAGAVLKRWHFHRRVGERHGGGGATAAMRAAGFDPPDRRPHPADPLESGLGGCLFNPIFYFCLQAVIFCCVAAFLLQGLGKASADEAGAGLFLTVLFGGIVLMIASTVLVYRYFSPPARPPRYDWMRHPATERVGDAFLFANMLCFQVLWNLLATMQISRVDSVGEFVGRLGLLGFVALLLYFPPRMLYLAEDLHRPRTWLGIGLANSVVIWRMLVGTGPG